MVAGIAFSHSVIKVTALYTDSNCPVLFPERFILPMTHNHVTINVGVYFCCLCYSPGQPNCLSLYRCYKTLICIVVISLEGTYYTLHLSEEHPAYFHLFACLFVYLFVLISFLKSLNLPIINQ